MPVLPFIEDNEENIRRIVTLTHENGAQYILPAFGMTLRDRQRAYYYAKLDKHFPGLRARYEKCFGERYSAHSPNAPALEKVFKSVCAEVGIPSRMPVFTPVPRVRKVQDQLPLF